MGLGCKNYLIGQGIRYISMDIMIMGKGIGYMTYYSRYEIMLFGAFDQ